MHYIAKAAGKSFEIEVEYHGTSQESYFWPPNHNAWLSDRLSMADSGTGRADLGCCSLDECDEATQVTLRSAPSATTWLGPLLLGICALVTHANTVKLPSGFRSFALIKLGASTVPSSQRCL